jgi:hypothetical protein
MPLYVRSSNHKIKKAILDNLKNTYRKSYPAIKKEIKNLLEEKIRKAFNESATVQALRGTIVDRIDLVAELGLEDNLQKIAQIRDTIIKGIQINIKADKATYLLSINIQISEKDFSDILSISAALQNWTDATGSEIKGPPLPWLSWLLKHGSNNIIKDFHFSTSERAGVGRSGRDGTMRKGDTWRVPAIHAGTESQNFITKIFDQVSEEINKKLWPTVRPVLTRVS